MSKDLLLKLQLKAIDLASRVVESVSNKIRQANQNVASSSRQSANAQQQSVRQTAQVSEQAARTAIQASRRVAQAREGLGIRSERQIQREIQRTVAQYERLKRSGTASARELARANEVARNKIRELNAEMGKTPMGQRLANIAQGVAGVGAGVMAAGAVLAPAMNDRKQWDANVANVALQAFGDKDKAYIQGEGIKQIQQAVLNTVKNVGGTHDQALGNLNAMMVNGMSFEQANGMLAQAQKMQVAGEASSEDIGALIKVLADYGFKGDELKTAFEYALRSGMDGKFEIKDMVGALPDLLATASNAGFKGLGDFSYILSWLQSAADKSGSNSEAANNVKNTLNKLTASDTIKRMEEIENPFKSGKAIDFKAALLDGREKGLNPVQVLSKIADGMLSKDAKYQQLQQKRKATTNEAEQAQIDSQLNLMKGFVLSKLLPDVQAKAGLNAAVDQKAMEERLGNLNKELTEGLGDKRFEVVSETDLAKEAQAKSLAFLGEQTSGALNNIERQFNDWQIKMAQENPELFSAFNSAVLGLKALSAAAIASAGALMLMGGRNGLGLSRLLPGFRLPNAMTTVGQSAVNAGRVASSAVNAGRATSMLGGVEAVAGRAMGGLGLLAIAAEQQPYVQAQSEVDDEKRSKAKEQFAKAMQPQQSSMFQYGVPVPTSTTHSQSSVPLYGGYALAALQKDNEIAQARLEMGTLSQAQYEARLARNQQRQQALLNPTASSVASSSSSAVSSVANFANGIVQFSSDLLQLKAAQATTESVLANYQGDFQAFGQQISEGLQAGLASQQHTLENRIFVELDSRVIAEQTSQVFFNFANRGTV